MLRISAQYIKYIEQLAMNMYFALLNFEGNLIVQVVRQPHFFHLKINCFSTGTMHPDRATSVI